MKRIIQKTYRFRLKPTKKQFQKDNTAKKYEIAYKSTLVFRLNYHLIMCVKYRNRVINDQISERLKEILEYRAPNYNITLKDRGHDSDHIHCLLEGHPNSALSKFINAYKSASSRLIKKCVNWNTFGLNPFV